MPDPFLSEIKYLGNANQDFIEVSVDAGYDISNLQVTVYRLNGTIRSLNDLSALSPTATVSGKYIYVIENGDATNFNGVALNEAVSLSENGTVYGFVSFDNTPGTVTATEGPASGLTSTEIGNAGSGASLDTTDGGQTYFTQTTPSPGAVACFTRGALIETKTGPVRVENLEPGMLIRTNRGDYRPLLWVFRRKVPQSELQQSPKKRPVRITAGALGYGLPVRDLVVSRQHRMMVSSTIAEKMFKAPDVLIAAIRLTELPGIDLDHSLSSIEYFHLLFEEHEVIYAEGAPTESLFLQDEGVVSLPSEVEQELTAIFPELPWPLKHPSSKMHIPDRSRQIGLVRRHAKNQAELVSAA